MKNSLLVLFSLLFANLLAAQTVYPSGVSGCIARWTFDTSEVSFLTALPDMSGNNNDGDTYNISSVNGFRNKLNAAGGFDGSSSWAEVDHKAMLNPSEITIVSLIKFNGFYTGNCQGNNIIYKGFDYFNDVSWSMAVVENDGSCTGVNPLVEKLYFTTLNTTPYVPPTNNFISTLKWYFLATTYDATTIKFYQIEMDTALKASSITPLNVLNSPQPMGNTSHNVFIGVTQNPPFKYWTNGAMDEVILFNKALTDTELYSVYSYLWGTPTQLSEVDNEANDIAITSNNNILNIKSKNNKINKVEIFDLNGRKFRECIDNFNSINLASFSNQLVFARISVGNNNIISRKIMIK